jgi:hypothetical protein
MNQGKQWVLQSTNYYPTRWRHWSSKRRTSEPTGCQDMLKGIRQQKIRRDVNETSTILTRQAMYVLRNNEARSRNNWCLGKAVSITYSECVSVALVTQHANRKPRIILSSVACPAVQYLSALSNKRHDFREKKLFNIKCVFWFSVQLLSENSSF